MCDWFRHYRENNRKIKSADGLVVGSAICREITRKHKKKTKSCHKCRQYGKKIKIENNMNWIKKIKRLVRILNVIFKKTRPKEQDIENSDWTSCCSGPVLKSEIFNDEQLNGLVKCLKHYRIPLSVLIIFLGKIIIKLLNTPSPPDDPLDWNGYKEKLAKRGRKINWPSLCKLLWPKVQLKELK